jgi:hypothetical protein
MAGRQQSCGSRSLPRAEERESAGVKRCWTPKTPNFMLKLEKWPKKVVEQEKIYSIGVGRKLI